ncbi:hypothetical protein Bca4012_057165 [Brassica carinata]
MSKSGGNQPVDRYLRRQVLGEGTYGVVYKATDTKTGKTVAVKKIRLGNQKEGVNFTALREIKLLKELNHPHIVELIDAFPHDGSLHLVFEYMQTDLEAVIRDRNIFLSPGDIKSYMLMTLKGLAYCHKKWVLHRDMKPNNLLIGENGLLKLADFGLARVFGSPNRRFTHQMMLRLSGYVDISFGFVSACHSRRLVNKRMYLLKQGSTEIDQLGKIFQAFGTPTQSQWSDMIYLPEYMEFSYTPAPPLRTIFPMASDDALDLLAKMFIYDPRQRITIQQALDHRYFSSSPSPTEPGKLQIPASKGDALEPKASEQNNQHGNSPAVLSPPGKMRRVMGPEGYS